MGWVNGHLFDIKPKHEQYSRLAADCVMQSLGREKTKHGLHAVLDLYRPMAELLTDDDRTRIGKKAQEILGGLPP